MPAPKGNAYWRQRYSHGRSPKFETADAIWQACVEYFDWVEANPLHSAETVKFQGEARIVKVPKLRAMTIEGMCLFIGITHQTWTQYRARDEGFAEVTSQADSIIRTQKFEGAAADLFNANIIARDLGLADRQKTETRLETGDSFHDIVEGFAAQKFSLASGS
jgi:hypothetical protein